MDDSRLELGAWNRDSLAALSVYTSATPGFELGASPMAPIGPYAKDCCSQADTPVAVRRNATQIQQHCAAALNDSMRQTDFLKMMVESVPDTFRHATFLASHAYPAANPGPNYPGCTGACGCWNAPFESARPWLTIFENESRIARPEPPHLPVVLSETGWCMDCTTQALRAQWTVQAYKEIWLPSPLVVAVTPFTLMDQPQGFPWIQDPNITLPVFDAVRELRCGLYHASDCDIDTDDATPSWAMRVTEVVATQRTHEGKNRRPPSATVGHLPLTYREKMMVAQAGWKSDDRPTGSPPLVTSLSASSFAVEGGGAPLLVHGSGFQANVNGTTCRISPAHSATKFGYEPSVEFNGTVISDTLLKCQPPAVLAPGPGMLDVRNDGGWSNGTSVEYVYLIDVALGRRPYISETSGHLLLRCNISLIGKGGVTVEASLPPPINARWRWEDLTLNGSNVLQFPLGTGHSSAAWMPSTVNADLKIVVTASWLEPRANRSITKWRRFMRAPPPQPGSAVPVQVDHFRRSLLVGGELFFGSGWFSHSGDNWWTPDGSTEGSWPMTLEATEAMVRMQAQLGDNIIMLYGLSNLNTSQALRLLDQCAAVGLKVMYPLDHELTGGAAHFNGTDMTKAWLLGNVSLVRNHSAILGYCALMHFLL
jgi:hypothetical protein